MSKRSDPVPIRTMQQITQRFPGQWVLIAEPKVNAKLEVQAGRVVAHSKDRDAVYRQLASASGQSLCIEYAGELPTDVAVIL